MGLFGKIIGAAAAEAVDQLASQEPLAPPDPLRWVKRIAAVAILLIGWLFILWTYRFHVTAPAVFVCIGFLAIEVAVYNLFRTGAQAVAEEDATDSTWGRPLGAKGELEREKKTLLKAIKEAEFDREMGKLSKVDADEMIGLYRARAIEVIKELDKLGGTPGTVREQIEREVKARLEIEARTRKPVEKAVKQQDKKRGSRDKKPAAAAKPAEPEPEAKAEEPADTEPPIETPANVPADVPDVSEQPAAKEASQ
ncbi:hypothetical protein BH11MYX3_BH11MYX3_35350 [soil metagenome]